MHPQLTCWKLILAIFITASSWMISTPNASAEDWKSYTDRSEFSLGGMTGLAVVDSSVGVAALGTISKKIISHGFVPDISDSVSLEGSFGSAFPNIASVLFSAHLRWDFEKDDTWTLFAIGGVGGNYASSRGFTELSPRFGIGAFCKVTDFLRLRAEVSHDLMGVGVNIPIY